MCSNTMGDGQADLPRVAGTVIQIAIEQTQPLSGTASARGGPASASGARSVEFVGWLDLLRAVSELVGATERSIDRHRGADERPTPQIERDRRT